MSDLSFKNFIDVVQKHPNWKPPARATVSGPLLDKAYAEVLERAKAIVDSCEKVAISTDGWSCPREQSYWSITIHGINSAGELVSAVLGSIAIYKSHTAKNIADALRPRLLEIGLSNDKMAAWVTDEGGAAPCVSEHFFCETIHCSGHLLQTVLRRAFKKASSTLPVLALILDITHNVCKLFRGSSDTRQQLSSLQRQHGQSISSIKRNVDTRWNTNLITLKSVAENEKPILNWMTNHDMETKSQHAFLLQANKRVYWMIIRELIAILQPFEDASNILSQDKVPTLHRVIPEVLSLQHKLNVLSTQSTQECCSHFASILSNEIDFKMKPWKKHEIMAAALSPSYHFSKYKDEILPGLSLLNDELSLLDPEAQPTMTRTSFLDDQDDYFDSPTFLPPHNPPSSSTSPVIGTYHHELQTFMAVTRSVDRKTPILDFWLSQRKLLPLLTRLAFRILCIPATQTTSERQFSLMRLIFHHLRGNLDPATANKVVVHSAFIRRRNLDILDSKRGTRSDFSIDADKRRQVSRNVTMAKKAASREGDNTETAIFDLTPYDTPETTELSDQLDFLLNTDACDDDGERSDDPDYTFLDSEPEGSPADSPPPSKRSKRGADATISTDGNHCCNLNTSPSDPTLILGYVDDGGLWSLGLTFERIFQSNYQYFTDYRLISPDESKRSFSCTLSPAGKKKFKTGRRGALWHIGEMLSFTLA